MDLPLALLAWTLCAVVVPALLLRSALARPVSADAPAAAPDQAHVHGVPRRAASSRSTLITAAPSAPDVRSLFDIVRIGAKKTPTARLFGARPLVRIIEESRNVAKSLPDGSTVSEPKIWKSFELGPYAWLSFADVAAITANIGAALRHLGLVAQSKVTLFASTSQEWMLMAHGCFSQNILITTAYDTLGEEGLAFSLNEGSVSTLFTQFDLLPVVKKIVSKVPSLKIIIYAGSPAPGVSTEPTITALRATHPHLTIYSLDEIRALGAQHPVDPVPPSPEDLCCIMYTSGSTGKPKGVMLTHANIVAAIAGADHIFNHYIGQDDFYLAYLPLAHVLEFTVEHFMMLRGVSIGYGSIRTLSDSSVKNCKGDMRELAPTIMAGVPAVWETIRKGVFAKLNSLRPLQRTIFDVACSFKWFLIQNGLPANFIDAFVFQRIKDQTGGRLKFALSGGAPMPPDTQRFMSICVCHVVQGYGMTETCGTLAIQTPHDAGTTGAVGPPMPSGEIKLVAVENTNYTPYPTTPGQLPSGEVWARGGSIMKGYYQQPAATAEVLTADGWLMTGDIGEWRPDGSLAIIDRKKNLVKLSNGEYVALEKLESQYKTSSLVTHLCVHADSLESYVVAIVVPTEKDLRVLASNVSTTSGIAITAAFETLCADSALTAKVLANLKDIARKAGFKPAEILGNIVLVADEWTSENGMLTAAQKIKRMDIVKKYQSQVKALYKK